MGRPLRPTLDVFVPPTRARHAPPNPPSDLITAVHIPAPTPLSPGARPRDDPAGGDAVERGAGVRFGNEDSAAERVNGERRVDVARRVWCGGRGASGEFGRFKSRRLSFSRIAV